METSITCQSTMKVGHFSAHSHMLTPLDMQIVCVSRIKRWQQKTYPDYRWKNQRETRCQVGSNACCADMPHGWAKWSECIASPNTPTCNPPSGLFYFRFCIEFRPGIFLIFMSALIFCLATFYS